MNRHHTFIVLQATKVHIIFFLLANISSSIHHCAHAEPITSLINGSRPRCVLPSSHPTTKNERRRGRAASHYNATTRSFNPTLFLKEMQIFQLLDSNGAKFHDIQHVPPTNCITKTRSTAAFVLLAELAIPFLLTVAESGGHFVSWLERLSIAASRFVLCGASRLLRSATKWNDT